MPVCFRGRAHGGQCTAGCGEERQKLRAAQCCSLCGRRKESGREVILWQVRTDASAITQVEMNEGYLVLSLLTESPGWRHASAEEGMESWGFAKVTSSDLDKEILTSGLSM